MKINGIYNRCPADNWEFVSNETCLNCPSLDVAVPREYDYCITKGALYEAEKRGEERGIRWKILKSF
jgi:hypothetical protein